MKLFTVVTLCGVVTHYDALSTFQAAELARTDGWVVVMVRAC